MMNTKTMVNFILSVVYQWCAVDDGHGHDVDNDNDEDNGMAITMKIKKNLRP